MMPYAHSEPVTVVHPSWDEWTPTDEEVARFVDGTDEPDLPDAA